MAAVSRRLPRGRCWGAGDAGSLPIYTRPMAKGAAKPRTVEVELPDEAFRHRTWHPQEVAREMQLLWILEEVRSRRLGFGKAAELSGLPVAQFLLLMGKHQISPFDYDEDELARELGS